MYTIRLGETSLIKFHELKEARNHTDVFELLYSTYKRLFYPIFIGNLCHYTDASFYFENKNNHSGRGAI